VSALPADSATVRSADLDDGWNQEDELLASIFDAVSLGNHYFLSANVADKDRKSLPKPARFPRPWEEREREEDEKPKLSTSDEVRSFFGTMAAAGPDAVRTEFPADSISEPGVADHSAEGTS
jgi:hypothetical protein